MHFINITIDWEQISTLNVFRLILGLIVINCKYYFKMEFSYRGLVTKESKKIYDNILKIKKNDVRLMIVYFSLFTSVCRNKKWTF